MCGVVEREEEEVLKCVGEGTVCMCVSRVCRVKEEEDWREKEEWCKGVCV